NLAARGRRWPARWLPARSLLTFGARLELGFVLGLLAFLHSLLDLLLRLGDRRQPGLPPLQLLGYRHPVRNIGGIGLLGQLQELPNLPLQLLLQLLRVPVRQGTV